VGPDIVTISREGLLDTHLVYSERCAAPGSCFASFLIPFVFTILTRIFHGPAELKHCSHMFSEQSKNAHEAKYNPGLRAFKCHHQHGFSSVSLPNLHFGIFFSAHRLNSSPSFLATLHLLAFVLGAGAFRRLLLFDVLIYLSLIFSAGRGLCT
jgi:hypothetical protein